jgi:hypothetical protein
MITPRTNEYGPIIDERSITEAITVIEKIRGAIEAVKNRLCD